MKAVIIFFLLIGISTQVFAQSPKALLVYFDDADEITVYDFAGNKIEGIYIGYPLLIGFAVSTGASTAEIQLKPNGSILKLQEHGFLKIEEMQGTKNAKTNRLALGRGLLRVVAAKLFGSNYMISTPSSVLGVRGTDFVVSTGNSGNTELYIKEGIVETYSPYSKSIDLFGPGYAASLDRYSTRLITEEYEEVMRTIDNQEFLSLAPDRVPRRTPKDYYIAFDYFKEIDDAAFRRFFEEEQYFADFERYIEEFESYYRQEMADFEQKYLQEMDEFEKYKNQEMEEFNRSRN